MKHRPTANRKPRTPGTPPHKARVLALLRMSEMDYNWIQLEEGKRYLDAYLNHDEYSVSVMETSRIFWAWWRNHWNLRDEQFVRDHSRTDVKQLLKLYRQYNSGSMLAQNITLNSVVLVESYHLMTHRIVKTETAKVW